uniref:Uncharacterized protein n=1 Tax=Ascaris lumbricoides TaxID=6252 RepID=A0A0M3INA7_ASCLU
MHLPACPIVSTLFLKDKIMEFLVYKDKNCLQTNFPASVAGIADSFDSRKALAHQILFYIFEAKHHQRNLFLLFLQTTGAFEVKMQFKAKKKEDADGDG